MAGLYFGRDFNLFHSLMRQRCFDCIGNPQAWPLFREEHAARARSPSKKSDTCLPRMWEQEAGEITVSRAPAVASRVMAKHRTSAVALSCPLSAGEAADSARRAKKAKRSPCVQTALVHDSSAEASDALCPVPVRSDCRHAMPC